MLTTQLYCRLTTIKTQHLWSFKNYVIYMWVKKWRIKFRLAKFLAPSKQLSNDIKLCTMVHEEHFSYIISVCTVKEEIKDWFRAVNRGIEAIKIRYHCVDTKDHTYRLKRTHQADTHTRFCQPHNVIKSNSSPITARSLISF